MAEPSNHGHQLCYSAGVMVLSEKNPCFIRYRSPEPVLTPELLQECRGIVANVVFPTGIDRRDDLGLPDRFDVYYGMADDRIGVACLNVPEHLPPMVLADGRDQESKFAPAVNLKEHLGQTMGSVIMEKSTLTEQKAAR
jgi:hypothetical protein